MKNIKSISDAFLCSNCGACKAICPKDAIHFKTSPLGRMYAEVNDSCIECKACIKVCPSIDFHSLHSIYPDRYIGEIKSVYIGKSTNIEIYKESQSGGACTTTLIYLFEHNLIDAAIVCRMKAANHPLVEAYVAESISQLLDSQKSKYTPVELLSALKQTSTKKSVAIVGLPCHLEGAESLIRQSKKFHNIKYKLGLICDRTLGSTLEDVIMSYIDKDEPGIIEWRKKDFSSNGKYYPYKLAPIRIKCNYNKIIVLPNTYRFALKEMFTPPRCRVCYDKLNIFADIVFGDPWGMSNVDWNKGESLVFTRTSSGDKLLKDMIDSGFVIMKTADIEELLKGQHINVRRRSVSAYAAALSSLPLPKTDSYLYKQNDVSNMTNNEKLSARNKMEDFLNDEKLTKEEIISKARKKINISLKKQKFNSLLIIRVLRKVKKILNVNK